MSSNNRSHIPERPQKPYGPTASPKSNSDDHSRTPERPQKPFVEMESKKRLSITESKVAVEEISRHERSARVSNADMSFEIKKWRDRQGFYERLNQTLNQIQEDGITLKLPLMILDHVQINQQNLCMIMSCLRTCTDTNTTEIEEGVKLFKVKIVKAKSENDEGETIENDEWMILIKCRDPVVHHAIYPHLNQRKSHKLRIGAYVFDERGILNPDRTESDQAIDSDVLKKPTKRVEKPILIDFTEGFRRDRTSAPRKHNRKDGAGLPTNHRDVRLPSYWKKTAICHSASIGYLSVASSEGTTINTPINQDRRKVILPPTAQTPERPSHSVEKGTSVLEQDTRVIDSTSMAQITNQRAPRSYTNSKSGTQRANQSVITQQVNRPIVYHDDNIKSNNKRTAIDQLNHSSSDEQSYRATKQQKRSSGWEGKGEKASKVPTNNEYTSANRYPSSSQHPN